MTVPAFTHAAAGVITSIELEHWHAGLEKALAAGEFFSSGTGVLIAG